MRKSPHVLGSLACLAALATSGLGQNPESLIKDLQWRNIGNANQKGRISDIDAVEDNFAHVVVGTASGGVYQSVNAGTTWESIFDNYGSASIGDVAIFQPNPDIIWVGTGEECSRNSAAWGDGIYKSMDGGRTFRNMGLEDTYTIGTVLTHPTDQDTVYVAALGNIWGSVGDRGFFKTTDGGLTWNKLTNGLPNDYDHTGAVEAIMHPTDPNTIYVAMWERLRSSYRLDSGGPNGGIYKTTDGGRSFTKLSTGLPEGDSGKIGLSISRSNPLVMMAHYEHGFQPSRNDPDYEDMSKLGSGIYRSEDGGDSWTFVNRYFSRPFYYNHVAIDPHDDQHSYHYNINFQHSEDGGKTLGRFGGGRNAGHCWHAIWLDPHNKDRFWQGNDGGLYLTHDAGESWQTFKNINATQYYAIGVDMRDPYWVYGGLQDAGTSGGPSMSRAGAIYTNDWISVGGGDGFHVLVDPTDYRTVYTEPHPGNTGGRAVRYDVETMQSSSIRPVKGQNIVNYDDYISPSMEALQEEKGWGPMGAFRWNWSSPLALSPHNPHTIYYGSNHLMKSTDKGETWQIISPDLSKNEYDKTIKASGGLTADEGPGGGAEFHGTLITVSESPVKPGVIWAGTDDGNVQVTINGGGSWRNTINNFPDVPARDFWVSRVRASTVDPGTAYVTLDGHRSANFQPWVFKTSDYGQTWTNIGSGLPQHHPAYVITQDPKNPDLLVVGTEFGIFFTLDDGETWTSLRNNLPTVAVHDVIIHPRDPDVIIGTHGRGLWIMDDISGLQQLSDEVVAKDAHLFDNETGTQWLSIRPMGTGGTFAFQGENPPSGAIINYWLGDDASGEVTFEISDITGERKQEFTVAAEPGIGKLEWNMRFSPPQARGGNRGQARGAAFGGRGQRGGRGGQRGQRGRGGRRGRGGGGTPAGPGSYLVKMTVGGETIAGTVEVRADPMRDR